MRKMMIMTLAKSMPKDIITILDNVRNHFIMYDTYEEGFVFDNESTYDSTDINILHDLFESECITVSKTQSIHMVYYINITFKGLWIENYCKHNQ